VLGHLPGLAPALERIENAFGPWNGASAPRVEEPAREAAVPAAAGLSAAVIASSTRPAAPVVIGSPLGAVRPRVHARHGPFASRFRQ
jgi:hypothetical protein